MDNNLIDRMEQVPYRNLLNKLSLFILTIVFALTLANPVVAATTVLPTQAVDTAAGEALFKANCAACHKLFKKATGPALFQVGDKYEKKWLYSWIKNSQELVKSGDAQANAIFKEYNGSVMTSFPQLSNIDIDNIIAYTYTAKKVATTAVVTTASSNANSGGFSNDLILGALVMVFVLLVVMLVLVQKTLKRIAEANGVAYAEAQERKPIWQAFVDNQFLVLVASIFMLLSSAYFAYGYLMQVGVDQGYTPVQPIHYSHRIHAGDNQIDCNYCHSSARKSKHSGIPSLNVCMNCHKSIGEVAETTLAEGKNEYEVDYNAEIQKLYAAVGWDEDAQSYTGETQPVKWIRIHNLPDFAYFNHSQHVTVAGVACQTCHGPVEEMEIMYQYAPLTMGWCINCHRETNIQVKENAYYEKIHEELSKKYGVENLTAAQMGGL